MQTTLDTTIHNSGSTQSFYKRLYVQVLAAVILGILCGHFYPDLGVAFKPAGDLFIKLVKMMIAPIIFCTVVTGIAKMGNIRDVGRVGLKAIVYFELLSTAALAIGLIIGNVVKPGRGMNIDPRTLDVSQISGFTKSAQNFGFINFVSDAIPDSLLSGLSSGNTLQVLLLAILLGFALILLGEDDSPLIRFVEQAQAALFKIIGMIMYLAPIGAFGAIAFTVGKYGLGSLQQLGLMMLCFYVTCVMFVFGVLGVIGWLSGFNLWQLLVYIKDEIFLVVGTSTSETALPRLMRKMEQLGIAKPVVGLVVPTGYSFNLDGISIYLTMAALFIGNATNIHLSLEQQLGLLAILLLTSKGAAAVTGGGFITLAATLSSTHTLPVAGLALLLGIDRFMSEARAVTNMIGNAVACIAIASWEKQIDRQKMISALCQKKDFKKI